MRYALVDPQNQIVRFNAYIDPNIQTKAGWRWLPCPTVEVPVINNAAQVISGPTYEVQNFSVTEVWAVRDKTTPELDAEKDLEISNVNRLQFLVSFDIENRVRVLEGKPAVTVQQYLAALKARL